VRTVPRRIGQARFRRLVPEPGCYDRIRAGTGLELHGNVLRRLMETGGYPRAVVVAAKKEEEWRQFVHSMPAEDWPAWIEAYCASSPEGLNTKRLLVRLRAELDEDKAGD
jgi:hypothetical protein